MLENNVLSWLDSKDSNPEVVNLQLKLAKKTAELTQKQGDLKIKKNTLKDAHLAIKEKEKEWQQKLANLDNLAQIQELNNDLEKLKQEQEKLFSAHRIQQTVLDIEIADLHQAVASLASQQAALSLQNANLERKADCLAQRTGSFALSERSVPSRNVGG